MMNKLALALAFFWTQCHADQVIGVSDGDTLTVLRENRPVRVRLANIDAPEKQQAYGARSKQSLSDLCYGRDATVQATDTDRYGRLVAVVICDGVNANVAQVSRGMAWVYFRYNRDSSLSAIEAAARKSKAGLWADPEPVEPWLFRRERKVNAAGERFAGPLGAG